jgi:predicted nucleic-acid-binding protein
MIGIDTNVMIRFLTADDPVQSPRARQFILDSCSSASPGYVSNVVLCEMVWVLRQSYRFSRSDIGNAVERLLDTPQIAFEDTDHVSRALAIFRNSSADFADCLIGLLNQEAGCTSTFTFDRTAAALPGFTAL